MYSREILWHGKTPSNIYSRYRSMMERCNNPNHASYSRYGGRGIKVCKEWHGKPVAFMEWALSNGYSRDLQLDRIDNDGDYSPSNCRWVTAKVNMSNTSVSWSSKEGDAAAVIECYRAGIKMPVLCKKCGVSASFARAVIRRKIFPEIYPEYGNPIEKIKEDIVGKKSAVIRITQEQRDAVRLRSDETGYKVSAIYAAIWEKGFEAYFALPAKPKNSKA